MEFFIAGIAIGFLLALLTSLFAEFNTGDGDEALEVTRWCLFGGYILVGIGLFFSLILR